MTDPSHFSHRRKLAHGEAHIRKFEACVARWERDGYRRFEKTNSHGRFELFAEFQQPLPNEAPLVVGDALQCMRDSLDHIVFALARKQTQTMTPQQEDDCAFPVSKTAAIVPTDRRIASVSPSAANDICALAPDPGRQDFDQHPIWLLHKTNNRDKHREVPIIAMAAAIQKAAVLRSDGTDWIWIRTPQRLEPNAPLMPLVEFARSPGVDMQITVATQVFFDQGIEVADREVRTTLRWFHDHIRDTVFQRLEPHL